MIVIGSGTPIVTNFGESKPIALEAEKSAAKGVPVLARKKGATAAKKVVTSKKTAAEPVKTEPKTEPAPAAEPTPTALASSLPRKTWTFTWDKPSFPGTIIAGIFTDTKPAEAGANVHVFFKPSKQIFASAYGQTAGKELVYFAGLYSPAATGNLKLVELPDDSVPSAWAPEIAAISSRAIQQKTNYRLLANTIARQWWGGVVSPASRDDWWITDGFARFSEARYVENAVGATGYEEVAKDMAVGSLAYDTVPLSSLGKLDPFSPEFQSLSTDKGASILHMLR